MKTRVALVNDDEVVVRGLHSMLRAYQDQIEIAQIRVRAPITVPVDVALYDTFSATQGNGPGVQSLLSNPLIDNVAVYTWNFQPWLTTATLQQGVRGYLSKRLAAQQLVHSIVAIHSGEVVVSPSQRGTPLIGGDWPGREEGLTPREAEVLTLITMGLDNQAIAERTVLSINSIKSYIRTAYRKIGVESRTRAVLWGLAHGMNPHHPNTRSVSEPH